jgi:hypothetical protein
MNLHKVKNLVKHFKVEGGLLKKPLLSRAVGDAYSLLEKKKRQYLINLVSRQFIYLHPSCFP